MKLSDTNFKNKDSIEITNLRHIDPTQDTPSVLEVGFNEDRTFDRVVARLDGQIIGVHERFTFVNNWLKKHTDFDTVVTDEIREFELQEEVS